MRPTFSFSLRSWVTLAAVLLVTASAPTPGAAQHGATPRRGATGYISALPPESAAEREVRHRRVAERRAQATLVMAHRGASAFAPENTLEAYAAAMDYGADGCEIDLRRTQDGVLVLFHDDMLDRLTVGFGTVEGTTYWELLKYRPRYVYGRATATTRPPTFAAVLALARQRAMLLHLDIKLSGLDADVKRSLDEADMWDHVVAINAGTGGSLLKDPRYRPIAYKGPGLFEQRRDWDPEAVRAQFARPGQGVMVDDPRLVARELRREPFQPVALASGLRQVWRMRLAPIKRNVMRIIAPLPDDLEDEKLRMSTERDPFGFLRSYLWSSFLPMQRPRVLEPDDQTPVPLEPSPKPAKPSREELLLVRAAACISFAEDPATDEIIRRLETLVWRRAMHPDWMLHGLDGAMAARALGTLRSRRSVPVLVRAFRRIDPKLKKVQDPRFNANPLAWTDFRLKMYILPALGEIQCPESKAFLLEYVRMEEAKARELAPLQWEEATRALLRQDLTLKETVELLRSPHSAVRGTAIQEYLDHPTPVRRAALLRMAPWALSLPTEGPTHRSGAAHP